MPSMIDAERMCDWILRAHQRMIDTTGDGPETRCQVVVLEMGGSINGGTPSHNPFLHGIFPYKFWGTPMTMEPPKLFMLEHPHSWSNKNLVVFARAEVGQISESWRGTKLWHWGTS